MDALSPNIAARKPDAARDAAHFEALLDELTLLARADLEPVEFYRRVLERLVAGVAGVGGAVWAVRPGADPDLLVELNFDALSLAVESAAGQSHRELVAAVVGAARAVAVPAHYSVRGPASATNFTPYTLLFAPVAIDVQPLAFLELLRPADAVDHDECLAVARAVAEIAAEYHQAEAVRLLRRRELHWTQYQQFTRSIHRPTQLAAICYAIANEARLLLGCDRVAVLIRRSRRSRVQAISGVDAVDVRANVVAKLEVLAQAVANGNGELWYSRTHASHDAEIEDLLQIYLDASPARTLAILPLTAEHQEGEDFAEPLGVLVAESFHAASFEEGFAQRFRALAEQASVAVQRGQELQRVPLLGLMRQVGRMGWLVRARQLPKSLAVLLVLIVSIAALVLAPAEFKVEARGELQPQRRATVFAASDGVVRSISVSHGQRVAQDAVLLTLRKPQLELELSRVEGERQTALRRLTSVLSARLDAQNNKAETPQQLRQLAAEEEELKVTLQGLEQQLKALQSQQADLQVRSPLDGEVLTWNIYQMLQARPVQRGQALLNVGDLSGPWSLELHIPDSAIGHVASARAKSGDSLPVEFYLGTEPGQRYYTELVETSLAIDTAPDGESSALATVKLADRLVAEPRVGATVLARIHCGKRSLGFVWFHGLWETIQRYW